MRDPFANYDSWLEQPYQDMYAEQERQEWIDENSTFETECCGVDVTEIEDIWEKWEKQQEILKTKRQSAAGADPLDWSEEDRKSLVLCTGCNEWYVVNKIEPDIPEYDGPEYEPPEEYDDPRN